MKFALSISADPSSTSPSTQDDGALTDALGRTARREIRNGRRRARLQQCERDLRGTIPVSGRHPGAESVGPSGRCRTVLGRLVTDAAAGRA